MGKGAIKHPLGFPNGSLSQGQAEKQSYDRSRKVSRGATLETFRLVLAVKNEWLTSKTLNALDFKYATS